MNGMLELTFFGDNSKVSFDVGRCCNKEIDGQPFVHGGQGRIYRSEIEHQGKPLDLALKVMPDSIPGTREVFRRLKGIRHSFMQLGYTRDPAFFGITHRGLPIAQGSATPTVFEWHPLDRTRVLNILAFNFVEGQIAGGLPVKCW